MTVSLFFDEDSGDQDLLEALRIRRINVVATIESGLAGRDDEEQLTWATEHQRVLYSFNRRDFYRIHSEWVRAGKTHGGIILALQQQYSVGEQMRRILRLIDTLSSEEMINRIEFLSAWG